MSFTLYLRCIDRNKRKKAMSDDYKIILGADVSGIVNAVQRTASSLSVLNTEAEKTNKGIQKSFTEASKATEIFSASAVRATQKASSQATSIKALALNTEDLRGEMAALQAQADRTYDGKKLTEYNKKIEDLKNRIEKATNAGKRGFDEFGNKLKQSDGILTKIKSNILNIGAAIGIAFGVQQIFSFGKEVVNLAIQTEGVKRAFDRINNPQLLKELREATRGTVSDLELMKAAVNAKNFDVPLKNFATLLSFAQQRARDTGQSVDYLVNSIVIGIGRKSPLILDNLGINTRRVREEFQRVGDFAQAAANVINEEMAKSGVIMDTNADKLNRLSAGWENLKAKAGEALIDIYDLSQGLNPFGVAEILVGKEQQELLKSINRNEYIRVQTFLKANKAGQEQVLKQEDENIKTAEKLLNDAQKRGIESEIKFQEDRLKAIKQGRERLIQAREALVDPASILNIESLELELVQYNEIIKKAEIGSAKFLEAQAEAKRVQKQIDDANGKTAEEEAKKRIEREKERAKILIDLEKELQRARVEAIQDAKERALAEEKLNYEQEKEAIQRRVKDFPELEKKKNELIEALRLSHNARLLAIQFDFYEKEQKIADNNQKALNDIIENARDKELEELDIAFSKRADQMRAQGRTEEEIENELRQKRVQIIDKYSIEALKRQEEIAILNAEITIKSEEDRQREILRIRIKSASRQLELIEAQGLAENELVIAQLRKVISASQRELDNIGKGKRSIYDLLGLELTDDEKRTLERSADMFIDAFTSILGTSIDKLKLDLDKRKDLIDDLKDQIKDVKAAIKEEEALQKDGFANNVEIKKQQLAELEEQKRKEIEIAKKQAEELSQLKKQEIEINAILQASNLAVAVSNIILSSSKSGLLGIFAAGAALASLYAILKTSKVKISQATEGTKFEKGGKIGGKRHSQGGEKFISENGVGTVLELEEGEFVTNRNSSSKYSNVLDAINKNDFSSLKPNDYGLNSLLKGTKVIRHGAERINKKQRSSNNEQNGYLSSIDSNIKKMANERKDTDSIVDMGSHIIEKKGNRTRVIRKR